MLVTFVEKLDSAEALTARKIMKAAKDKKLDEAVAMWFMQKQGVPIYGPILMAKTLQFHTKLNPDSGEELKEALGGPRIFSIDMG